MKVLAIPYKDIHTPKNRQRKEFKSEDIISLAGSISKNGLFHPVLVRPNGANQYYLIAGERRMRAMEYVWNFGESVKCGDSQFPEGVIPCISMGDLSPIDAYEAELEENIRRVDLTWQERASAESQLYELRRLQAEKAKEPLPTFGDISTEIYGNEYSASTVRRDILVSKHLDDPDVSKAKTADEAFKIIKRKEDLKRSAMLAEQVGSQFTSALHQVFNADCVQTCAELPDASFDIILTDPPYGISADQFSDSGGKAFGAHFYDDSFQSWIKLMKWFGPEMYRLAKPASHLYAFCDIDNFVILKSLMTEAGWKVFRTPIIWFNPGANRAPWPQQGPMRKYQIILYAVKGDKPLKVLAPDVLEFRNDENLNHPAQKPVALFQELLKRSSNPGEQVLDPFMGSGTILPACHELKCLATGIEIDPAAYGIAINRLKELV